MNGRCLILNPGPNEITLADSEAGYAEGVLWLYIQGQTLAQAFALLSDPANTAAIEFRYGEMADRFEGFTCLTGLMARDGLISASLVREEGEHV